MRVLCLLLCAACGSVAPTTSGGHGDAGHGSSDARLPSDAVSQADTTGPQVDAPSRHDAGVDCGQPAHDEYSCPKGPVPDGGCPPYGEDAAAVYPLGCMVTLTTCDPNFPGAFTCNCQVFPSMGPEWICPL